MTLTHDLLDELHVVNGAAVIRVKHLHQPLQRHVAQVQVVRLQEPRELAERQLAVGVGVHGLEEAAERREASLELRVDLTRAGRHVSPNAFVRRERQA